MADDEEGQGASGPEELLAPTGPRRASFTPAPNTAESLQAAANLFDDDAIAEALAAELARVASGPIPIQRPPVQVPVSEPVAEVTAPTPPVPEALVVSVPEPEPVVSEPEPEPVASDPVVSEPEPEPAADQTVTTFSELIAEPSSVSAPEPEAAAVESAPPAPVSEPVAEPAIASVPEPAPVAEAVAVEAPADPPGWASAPEPVAERTPDSIPEAEPEPVPTTESEQEQVVDEKLPAAPQGPPDWATPLFGTPAPAAQDEPSPSDPITDPFAPSAPSFAPSNGPFPPPGDSTPEPDPVSTPFPTTESAPESLQSGDADTLRALYSAAPAPTVPAANAPPPPGYDAPPPPTSTLSAIEELQAQLDERDRDSREYAAWESSMLEVGTPEALAAVDQARAERAGTPSVPSAPVAPPAPPTEEPAAFLPPPVEEPAAFLPPPADDFTALVAPPVEEPAAIVSPPAEQPAASPAPAMDEPAPFVPPTEEPAAYLAPPVDEPAPFLAPPVDEPAPFLPAPVDEPAPFLSAPVEEPAAFLPAPVDEPAAFLPPPPDEPAPFVAPPVEEPAAFFPSPAEEPVTSTVFALDDQPTSERPASDNPFDIFAASIDQQAAPTATPSDEATPFPGFAPPTDASTIDFSAPADPRELRFDAQATTPDAPAADAPLPDAPVFLEPTSTPTPNASVPSPPGPRSWNIDEPIIFQPTAEEYAAAQPTSEEHEAAGSPPALVEPPAPDGVADLWRTASESDLASAAPAPEPTPVVEAPAPIAETPPPSAPVTEAWPPVPSPAPELPPVAPPPAGFDDLLSTPAPDPQPPGSAWITGEPNPFVEPTNDAATGDRRPFGEGVGRDEAIDPSHNNFGASLEPVRVSAAGTAVTPEYVVVESQPVPVADSAAIILPVAPRVVPAEPVGLEPTPVEQRIGRAARLFWLWFAANSSIAAVIFGTILFALGVSLRQAVVATLAGVALSFLPLGLGTLAGKRSGQPTMVISRATFGLVGNILPALIALVSRLFWGAALLWVLGAGTSDILTGAQLADGFTTGQLTLLVMAIGFVLAVVIAYFGYALMAIAQLVVSIVSGVAILGFIVLTAKYVDFSTALSTQDGPWILVVTGAVLVFSFVGLAWANSSADVARYQRPGSSGAASMLWATFGVALPSFVLIAYGALLAASNAKLAADVEADPLESLGQLLPGWYPWPLLIATALSLLSGIVLALYSGGFAIKAAGFPLLRSLSTLITGVLLALIAIIMANALTNFSQLFRDFATTVAVPVAAWAGIFGSEIMIRKRRFDSYSLLNRGGVYEDARWANLIALVVISLIGYGFLSATMPGLGWQGFLFSALGVPLDSQFAMSDLGVLVALLLGLAFPLIAGRGAIRAQEEAERSPE